MLLLTATNQSLEVQTSASPSTDYQASWVDLVTGTSPSVTPGSGQGNIASATTTTVVAAPAASTTRQLKSLTVRNRGVSPNTLTVKKDVAGTEYHLLGAVPLQPGETLAYEDGQGFRIFDALGSAKATNFVIQVPATLMTPHFASSNLTTAKTLSAGISYAAYLGKAPRSIASAVVRWRMTTAAASVTWAEVALAKGPVVVGGSPTLTIVGWADALADFLSTGIKTRIAYVAAGQTLGADDDLWVILGQDAVTLGAVRVQSIADDLQVGVQAVATARPSSNVGTAVAFAIEGASTQAAWVGCLL